MKKLLLFFCLMMFVACEEKPPQNLIPEETYKRMFIEFAIINQYDQSLLQDRSREEIRRLVYDYYDVSEEEFRISHHYYERDVENHLKRLDEINQMMRAERDTLLEAEKIYETNQRTPPDTLRQPVLNR